MITTFITAQIIWMMNTSFNPCKEPNIACYVQDTNTIYIKKNIHYLKDFVLYHEIGHSIYKNDFEKELFTQTFLSTNYEIVADNFGWWIYGQKHPKEQSFVDKVVSKEQMEYFKKGCSVECINNILAIKLK